MSDLLELLRQPDIKSEENLDLISLEDDYIEGGELLLDLCKYNDSLDELFSIENRVYNQYVQLENLKQNNFNSYSNLQAIGITVNSIIKPIELNYVIPSNESNGSYIESWVIEASLEGAKDVLRKIKEFIINLYNGFINMIKKAFNAIKGIFVKTKSNAKRAKANTDERIGVITKAPDPGPTKIVTPEERIDVITKAPDPGPTKIVTPEEREKKVDSKKVAEEINTYPFNDLIGSGYETDVVHVVNCIENTHSIVLNIINNPVWKMNEYDNLKKELDKALTANDKNDNDKTIINTVNIATGIFKNLSSTISIKKTGDIKKEYINHNTYSLILGSKAIVYSIPNVEFKEVKNDISASYNEYFSNCLSKCGYSIKKIANFKPSNVVRFSKMDSLKFNDSLLKIFVDLLDIKLEDFIKEGESNVENSRLDFVKAVDEVNASGDLETVYKNIPIKILNEIRFTVLKNNVIPAIQILNWYTSVTNKLMKNTTKDIDKLLKSDEPIDF